MFANASNAEWSSLWLTNCRMVLRYHSGREIEAWPGSVVSMKWRWRCATYLIIYEMDFLRFLLGSCGWMVEMDIDKVMNKSLQWKLLINIQAHMTTKILKYLHLFKLFILPTQEWWARILQFITSRFTTGRSANSAIAFCCSGTWGGGRKHGTFSRKRHFHSKRGRTKNMLRTKGASHRPWREMRFDERGHWMRKEARHTHFISMVSYQLRVDFRDLVTLQDIGFPSQPCFPIMLLFLP